MVGVTLVTVKSCRRDHRLMRLVRRHATLLGRKKCGRYGCDNKKLPMNVPNRQPRNANKKNRKKRIEKIT